MSSGPSARPVIYTGTPVRVERTGEAKSRPTKGQGAAGPMMAAARTETSGGSGPISREVFEAGAPRRVRPVPSKGETS